MAGLETTTHFAAPERASPDVLQAQFSCFAGLGRVPEFLNCVPNIVLILNGQRQIVFWNDALLEQLGARRPDEGFLGQRPGETLCCVHCLETPGGCGTSEHCRSCGVALAVLETLEGHTKSVRECRLTRQVSGTVECGEYRVWTSPLTANGQPFVVFSLADISPEKRRDALQRVLLHDIMDTAGALQRCAELMRDNIRIFSEAEFDHLVYSLSARLISDIGAHKRLLQAERQELVAHNTDVMTSDLLERAIALEEYVTMRERKKIRVSLHAASVRISSDPDLLGTVLHEMLRNALEASKSGECVTIGCDVVGQTVRFWVKSLAAIPVEVQEHVFERSFSTRGQARGLGTYSMKLLTESYLRGRMSFVSTEEDGTTFTCEIPVGGSGAGDSRLPDRSTA